MHQRVPKDAGMPNIQRMVGIRHAHLSENNTEQSSVQCPEDSYRCCHAFLLENDVDPMEVGPP